MNEYLKDQLQKLEAFEKKADAAEKAYAADPMNEAKERAFDKWYRREYTQYIALAEAIVSATSGQINIDTAKRMIQTKRSELISLLS